MPVYYEKITQACESICRDIHGSYKDLTISFISYQPGNFGGALDLASSDILYHPAASQALDLLSRTREQDKSTVIGLTFGHQDLLFGMASRDAYLALCTLNNGQYDTFKQACRDIYHLIWHVLNDYKRHKKRTVTDHLVDQKTIIRYKYTPLQIIRNNLKADIFSSIIMYLRGDKTAAIDTGTMRAQNALTRNPSEAAEYYPFAITAETVQYILRKEISREMLENLAMEKDKQIEFALSLTEKISATFDEQSIKAWLAFCIPAQTMAWKNFATRDILSAGIHTSEDTSVRNIALLIGDLAKISPTSILKIKNNFSAFTDRRLNRKIYEDANRIVSEDSLAQRFGNKTPSIGVNAK